MRVRARACAWFYDTWGFLALANRGDADHALAAEADRWRDERGILVVTSDYVLDETLTGLSKAAGGRTAIRFLDFFEARVAASRLTLAEVNRPRREAALSLFRRLAPGSPGLSFTDCTSFALMQELGLTETFTADRHFHRAGGGIRPLFTLQGKNLLWSPDRDRN